EDTLPALLGEKVRQLFPDAERALGRPGKEGLITVIRGVIRLDEIPDIDVLRPQAGFERGPIALGLRLGLRISLQDRRRHVALRSRLGGDKLGLVSDAETTALWAGFTKDEGEQDGDRNRVKQRLESLLVMWKLALSAGADAGQCLGEEGTEQ